MGNSSKDKALGWACTGVGAQQAQAWALGHARGARTGARRADGQVLDVQGRAERRARGQELGVGGRRWAQAAGGRLGRARGAERQSARGAQAAGRQAHARQGAAGVGARGAGLGRAGRVAWALGAWAGCGLCTRCTWPIFDPF